MLTKITITDTSKTPLNYVRNIWGNGVSWEFKPGVNIIVGENGCGKSTLLKLISHYGLCTEGMVSQLPRMEDMFKLDILFEKSLKKPDTLLDGCIVNMDYNGVLFRYTPASEFQGKDTLSSFDAFGLYNCKVSSSTGESMLDALGVLFKKMNDTKEISFPIRTIKDYAKSLNDVWSQRMKMLLDYYAKNQVAINEKDFEFTVLLDEPDRNLDIMHIKELYNILSYHRPLTQLICVIHNPVLIYKLMQTDVNFIEMTPSYLNNVKNFIRWDK